MKLTWGYLGRKEDFRVKRKVVGVAIEAPKHLLPPTTTVRVPKGIICTNMAGKAPHSTSLDSLELSQRLKTMSSRLGRR